MFYGRDDSRATFRRDAEAFFASLIVNPMANTLAKP